MAAGTIPMLIIAGIPFIPAGPMLMPDLDPNLNCEPVINRVLTEFKADADVKIPCVIIEEPCGRGAVEKCKGGDWIR